MTTGLLDVVPDLRVTQETQELLRFEWSEPYTLLGVPVLEYEIILQLTNTKNPEDKVLISSTISEQEFSATKYQINSPCISVNFTISAINMVGVGNATNTMARFAEGKAFYNEMVCLFSLNERFNEITYCACNFASL